MDWVVIVSPSSDDQDAIPTDAQVRGPMTEVGAGILLRAVMATEPYRHGRIHACMRAMKPPSDPAVDLAALVDSIGRPAAGRGAAAGKSEGGVVNRPWYVSNTTAQNSRGEWVPAVPVPLYRWGRKWCGCGAGFWTEAGYRGHYAYRHVLRMDR